MTIGRALFIIGLATGLIALGIRYPLHIYEQMSEGRGLLDSIAHLLSFFTIVMNTLVVLCYLSFTPQLGGKLGFFRRPVIVGTAIAGILIVMIVYHLLLSATHNPTGISVFTNICLHYIAPVVFPLWWYFDGRKGTTTWNMVPAMMIIPVLYLVWVYVRAGFTGEYPYQFLNVAEKGISGVAPVILAITVLFLVFGGIVAFLDKRQSVRS